MVAQMFVEGPALDLHFQAEHQTLAAHQLEQIGMIADKLFQRAAQPLTLGRNIGQKRLVRNDLPHGLARRHGQRIAAIGGAVAAKAHAPRALFGGEAGAQWKAAGNALGGRQDVRLHAIQLMRIELAGAPHAALHLVQHQHQILFVADVAQAGQEFLAGRTDTAFALDRFDQEAGGVRANGSARRFQIVKLHIFEARQQWQEALVHLVLIGGADGGHGAAVEGHGKGDDLGPVRIAALALMIGARGLDRAFHRLGPGIGEEHRIGKGRVHDHLRQPLALRAAIHVGHVHQLGRLALDRLDQRRMAVPERIHRDAAGKVQQPPAILGNQMAAIALHRTHIATRIDGHKRSDGHGGRPFM